MLRWVSGVADGTVPDYQSAALLMAIVWRGMSRVEMVAMTEAMLRSGRVLRWDTLGRPTVDKHSTGGVGDKISIALAPWVAACGAAVPMISGRGLGHTGGTLDKLEAIPGFRTRVTTEEFEAQLRRVGVVMAGPSEDLAPADARLYALRDVTATVESRPLIVASILSKKLASGTAGVVFDVKCGGGAFMRTREDARSLARDLVDTARMMNTGATALLTAMDQPLGHAVGNGSEAAEAFAILRGEAPGDVAELTLRLAQEMLVLCGVAREPHEAEARLRLALESGRAVERAEAMVQAQGGDPHVVAEPGRLPRASVETPVRAGRSGFVASVDARAIGELLVDMGGGRQVKEQAIDHAVGIRLCRKGGQEVRAGETLAVIEAHRDAPEWAARALAAYAIADAAPAAAPLVLEAVR
jgi:pyrimidine-nucleoside phosphorylase/thymidine phosphorylase